MAQRKIQPVSFSLTDPFESELLKHAEKNGAFSKYVKRLIQRDMEKGVRVIPSNTKGPAAGNTIKIGEGSGLVFKL